MREGNEKDFLLRNSLGDLDFSSSDSSERQAERTIARVTRDYIESYMVYQNHREPRTKQPSRKSKISTNSPLLPLAHSPLTPHELV